MATAVALPAPVLPFGPPQEELKPVAVVTTEHSLLEIDREMDVLFDRIQDELEETGEPSEESKNRFQQLCDVFGDKVDRIGRFIRVMEARAAYCKGESARLATRGRIAENKVYQTKAFILYFLQSREVTKMEGKQFTLRRQKNPQDSVRITDPAQIPLRLKRVEARFDGELWEQIIAAVPADTRALLVAGIQETTPVNDAIKQAIARKEDVAGATVTRGYHVRVA
jgi:hypothetical protein